MSKVNASKRLSGIPTKTIWEEMTPLAVKHNAVNLGQGFPNFAPPSFLLRELSEVVDNSSSAPLTHQYTAVRGRPELVSQLQRIYTKLFKRNVSASEVLVTNGVTQGLNAVMHAYLDDGDEVILIEPYYDAYPEDVRTAGGTAKYVHLTPSNVSADEWTLSEEDLRGAVTDRTKFLLLNTPQNIPGKVWSEGELLMIAKLAQEKDFIVISDEVYMNLTYGRGHISIATLPGMVDRTITLCSAGKSLSCTGWKIGWVIACERLLVPVLQTVAYQSFCTATPLQIAVGRGLVYADESGYYETTCTEYKQRMDLLSEALKDCGLSPLKTNGGFFIMADISLVDPCHFYDPTNTEYAKDWQFCLWLTKTIGVCAIPTTAFCQPESKHIYETFVRFACCKPDHEIAEAVKRLSSLRNYLKQ